MAFAAALSEHPSPPEAVGEVVGSVLDALGPAPDVAVVFVTRALAGVLDDVAAAVRATLAPGVLVGASAAAVVGGGREVEEGPGIALWAGRTGPATPVRITVEPDEGGVRRVDGMPTAAGDGPRTLVLLADPYTVPVDGLLAGTGEALPDLAVVGGLVSGARGPGGNRLVLDDRVHTDGAVGVLLPRDVAATPVVSQGCRPVGEPMIVTAADGPLLLALAGVPALDRLIEVGRTMGDADRALFEAGPQIGVVADERSPTFGTGDFLIRSVNGADADRRGVLVGERVPVGTTVQFQVRDAGGAGAELRRSLADVGLRSGRRPPSTGALLFTCTGRGSRFFGEPDHDADLVVAAVGPAVAGMACAGEIGPVAGRNHVHAFTASVLVVRDPAGD